MSVKPIINILPSNQNTKTIIQPKKINYTKITGYGAVGTMGFSILAANSKKYKLHKNLAILSGILTLLHIGIVESYNLKKKFHNK